MRKSGRTVGGSWGAVLVCLLLAGCGGDNGTGPQGTPGNPATMPLENGNEWTFAVAVETQVGDPDNYTVYDEIAGTKEFEGEEYSWFHSIEIDVVRGDTTAVGDSYLRQEGQQLWAYAEIDTSGANLDEYMSFIYGNINESQPWKVAEFTSLSGETWDVLNAEKTWNLEGEGSATGVLRATISNEGRVRVTVPAGTFDDVYKGRRELTFTFVVIEPPLPPIEVVGSETQITYVKDGVGIVKQEYEFRVTQAGVELQHVTSTSELKKYELQP